MGPSVSSSEGSFCYLTDDLLMDILSRLPPKSLVTCKSVSKAFHRLVSTLIHSPTVPRPLSGLLIVEVDPIQGTMESFEYFILKTNGAYLDDESLSFLPCDPDTRIIDCRGGLLLCASTNWVDGDQCYVCNPVTKQWVALPPPPKHGFSNNCNFDVNLALVLDESSDVFVSHYKVFLFVTLSSENLKPELDVNVESSKDGNEEQLTDLYVHVYSSKTGQWVESNGYSIGISFRLLEKRAVFLNGALLLPADPSLFLKFDVEEECIEVMNLPTYSDTPQFIPSICLGESQGCLNYAYHNGSKMEVWMGEIENSEWVVKHRIKLDDIEFPEPLEDPDFFEDSINEEPLDILAIHPTKDAIFLRNQGVFLCYDFTSGAIDTVMRYDYGATVSMCYWVFSFSECLRSLANAHPRS